MITKVDGVCGNAVSGEVNTISYVLRVEYPHTRHGEFSLKVVILLEGQYNLFEMALGTCRSVMQIERDTAKPFVERIHYSRKYPSNIVYAFGLYENSILVGVVTYGIPASPPLCRGIAGDKNKDRVLELNRLAIEPGMNGDNRASYLVSHSLRMLPNRTFVVSYADTGWTHVGYVYQACNFLYSGMSAKRVDSYRADGKHPRSYDKNNHSELHQTRNPKHRYIYLVGTKRDRKNMLKELKYPVYDKYPKGDEVRYDTNNPQIAVPIQIVRKGEGKRTVGITSDEGA